MGGSCGADGQHGDQLGSRGEEPGGDASGCDGLDGDLDGIGEIEIRNRQGTGSGESGIGFSESLAGVVACTNGDRGCVVAAGNCDNDGGGFCGGFSRSGARTVCDLDGIGELKDFACGKELKGPVPASLTRAGAKGPGEVGTRCRIGR